jgi:hypothetical protein
LSVWKLRTASNPPIVIQLATSPTANQATIMM